MEQPATINPITGVIAYDDLPAKHNDRLSLYCKKHYEIIRRWNLGSTPAQIAYQLGQSIEVVETIIHDYEQLYLVEQRRKAASANYRTILDNLPRHREPKDLRPLLPRIKTFIEQHGLDIDQLAQHFYVDEYELKMFLEQNDIYDT